MSVASSCFLLPVPSLGFCASSGGGHGAGVVFFLPPLGWRPRTWWALWASLPRSRFLLSLPPSLPPREPDLGPVCFSGRRRLLRFWQIRSVFTVCRFTSWLLVEFSGCQIEKIEKNNNKTQRETLERTNLAATVFVGCCARSDVVM